MNTLLKELYEKMLKRAIVNAWEYNSYPKNGFLFNINFLNKPIRHINDFDNLTVIDSNPAAVVFTLKNYKKPKIVDLDRIIRDCSFWADFTKTRDMTSYERGGAWEYQNKFTKLKTDEEKVAFLQNILGIK